MGLYLTLSPCFIKKKTLNKFLVSFPDKPLFLKITIKKCKSNYFIRTGSFLLVWLKGAMKDKTEINVFIITNKCLLRQ